MGLVVFTVLSITPSGPLDPIHPLVGLAEATSQMAPTELAGGEVWYVRADRVERVELEATEAEKTTSVTFVVSSVEETWLDDDVTAIQRRSVQNVEFLDPADADRLADLPLAERYTPGWVEESNVEIAYPATHTIWDESAGGLLLELSEQVGGSGDIGRDRVELLDAVGTLIQYHGMDPAKRGKLLLALSYVPEFEVVERGEAIRVRCRYAVGDTPQVIELDFDADTGELLSEAVSTVATPDVPAVLLSQARFHTGLAEAAESAS